MVAEVQESRRFEGVGDGDSNGAFFGWGACEKGREVDYLGKTSE